MRSVSGSALRITALKASSVVRQLATYSQGASSMAVDRKCSCFLRRQAATLSLICWAWPSSPIIPRADFCMSLKSQKSFLKAKTASSLGILRQYFSSEFFSLLQKALMSHMMTIFRNSFCFTNCGRYMRLNRNQLLLRCYSTVIRPYTFPHKSPKNCFSSSVGIRSPLRITTASVFGLPCRSCLMRWKSTAFFSRRWKQAISKRSLWVICRRPTTALRKSSWDSSRANYSEENRLWKREWAVRNYLEVKIGCTCWMRASLSLCPLPRLAPLDRTSIIIYSPAHLPPKNMPSAPLSEQTLPRLPSQPAPHEALAHPSLPRSVHPPFQLSLGTVVDQQPASLEDLAQAVSAGACSPSLQGTGLLPCYSFLDSPSVLFPLTHAVVDVRGQFAFGVGFGLIPAVLPSSPALALRV